MIVAVLIFLIHGLYLIPEFQNTKPNEIFLRFMT